MAERSRVEKDVSERFPAPLVVDRRCAGRSRIPRAGLGLGKIILSATDSVVNHDICQSPAEADSTASESVPGSVSCQRDTESDSRRRDRGKPDSESHGVTYS